MILQINLKERKRLGIPVTDFVVLTVLSSCPGGMDMVSLAEACLIPEVVVEDAIRLLAEKGLVKIDGDSVFAASNVFADKDKAQRDIAQAATERVLKIINESTGTKLRYGKEHRTAINKALHAGFTPTEIAHVVAYCAEVWDNPEMRQYITPMNILAPTKLRAKIDAMQMSGWQSGASFLSRKYRSHGNGYSPIDEPMHEVIRRLLATDPLYSLGILWHIKMCPITNQKWDATIRAIGSMEAFEAALQTFSQSCKTKGFRSPMDVTQWLANFASANHNK